MDQTEQSALVLGGGKGNGGWNWPQEGMPGSAS